MEDNKPRVSPDNSRPQPDRGYSPRSNTFLLLYSLTLSLIFLVALSTKSVAIPVKAQTLTSTTPPASMIPTQPPSPAPTQSPDPLFHTVTNPQDIEQLRKQKESIRQYVNTIFGKNGKTAFAIALAESGKSYKGERFFATSAVHRSQVEVSVGLFQINLKNSTTKVHLDRIPGATLQEKIDWLSNPYNNTLFAYWIFSTSGFNPWSVYSNGTYLAYAK